MSAVFPYLRKARRKRKRKTSEKRRRSSPGGRGGLSSVPHAQILMEVEMRSIEVFTCDCYPPDEVIKIVKEVLKEAGEDYILREYNINKNPEEYSKSVTSPH